MEILSIVLTCIGVLIALIFGIQLLILAFRTSIWWGLGYLFVPIVGLIFVIANWSVAKKPFLLSLIALPFIAVGAMLAPINS